MKDSYISTDMAMHYWMLDFLDIQCHWALELDEETDQVLVVWGHDLKSGSYTVSSRADWMKYGTVLINRGLLETLIRLSGCARLT